MKPCLLPCLLAAALSLSPAQTPPPPDLGEERQSLDGTWEFTTDPQLAAGGGAKWDALTVPGNWDTQPAYSTHVGKGWYRRTFSVPAAWKGKQLRLCFGAVYEHADVSLNGVPLGSHDGGYTPFEFDVTGRVACGGDNTVVVCADNTYQRGAWWPWGGISRSVFLAANNDARIVWQHIQADPDLAAGTARITVRCRVANAAEAPRTVHLRSAVAGLDLPGAAAEADVAVPARGEADGILSLSLPKEAVKLWDFDHPNLYRLDTVASVGGAAVHARGDRFGIRQVAVTPDGLWLNGEKVRLTGFNRVADSYATGNTEPDSLVHADVDMMKRCGATMSRLIHYPEAPNLLDYLDEKGMLIFEEIPVWGVGDPNVKTDNPRTKQWLREMIDRDYNHPCIIGWSPGNEIQGHFAYVKSMYDYIRGELDPTRLLSYASNTAQYYSRESDPALVSDIVMVNSYGNFAAALGAVHKKWPDKPVFFSEWGLRQFGADPSSRIPDFDKSVAGTIEGHPYLVGFSLWTFNDYRSSRKGTPASGNREWGVVDVDRHPKAAYDQARRAFCPVHAFAVASGKIRIEPRSPDEIPSYAVRGYKVAWKAADGTSGEIAVPDLRPGDAPWEAPLPGPAPLQAALVTPVGYAVAEAAGQP